MSHRSLIRNTTTFHNEDDQQQVEQSLLNNLEEELIEEEELVELTNMAESNNNNNDNQRPVQVIPPPPTITTTRQPTINPFGVNFNTSMYRSPFDNNSSRNSNTVSSLDASQQQQHQHTEQTTIDEGDESNNNGQNIPESNFLFELCQRVALSSRNNEIDFVDIEDMWQDIRDWLNNNNEEDKYLALETSGEFQTTALHLACKAFDPPEDIIKLLINCRKEVVGTTDTFSWIPLHYACANCASPGVIISLLDAFPNGNITQDRRNRT